MSMMKSDELEAIRNATTEELLAELKRRDYIVEVRAMTENDKKRMQIPSETIDHNDKELWNQIHSVLDALRNRYGCMGEDDKYTYEDHAWYLYDDVKRGIELKESLIELLDEDYPEFDYDEEEIAEVIAEYKQKEEIERE